MILQSEKCPFRQALVAVLLTLGLGMTVPALAGAPPDHAPAHGWRKKHDARYVGHDGRQWERDYGIVQGRCDRAAIGTALGGVIGGALGSQVGDGSGRLVAILIGTAVGAVIGREVGKDMDDADRACIGHALELARDGQRVRWSNDRTGATFQLTPVVGQHSPGCRDFRLETTLVSTVTVRTDSQACRTGDGAWQIRAR